MTVSSTAVHESPDTVLVQSVLFGPIAVQVDACVTFEEGLLGFEGPQRFVLLPTIPDGVLWLQGVDDGSMVFLVVEPDAHISDYSFDLSVAERSATGLTADSVTAVVAIVSLPSNATEPCTANLQAPLLIDFATGRGWQLVLADSSYATRHPINLPLSRVGELAK